MKIVIGKVLYCREGCDDGCYCEHSSGEFCINNKDYINDLVREEGIKYLVFDEKPSNLIIEDGEYDLFTKEFDILKNFITENILLELYAIKTETEYTGRCYSEWTCGEGDVTLDAVRCKEISSLKNKYIMLIL